MQGLVDERSQVLCIEGLRVHARAEGKGPALLLLHGVLDSLHGWERWSEPLREEYRLIRIDIPPFGLSAARSDRNYDPDLLMPVLDAVLDAYGVASAVLVGNSLGGYFAAYYAMRRPQRVEALVLISPAAYPQSLPFLLRFVAWPVVGKLFEVAAPRAVVRWAMRSLYGDSRKVCEEDVRRRHGLLRGRAKRAAARDVVRLMARRAGQEPEWIRRIECPALLIWGEKDTWVPPELAQRWMRDLARARLIVFPAVGHLAMEEAPRSSADALRRFLAEQGIGASDGGAGPFGCRLE